MTRSAFLSIAAITRRNGLGHAVSAHSVALRGEWMQTFPDIDGLCGHFAGVFLAPV